MSSNAQYIRDHVFFRCGHAVSRLCDAGLLSRPELPTSETEIHEWWLVSSDLAARLAAAGQPVLHFHEMHLWGRGSALGELKDDVDLRAALATTPARPAH